MLLENPENFLILTNYDIEDEITLVAACCKNERTRGRK